MNSFDEYHVIFTNDSGNKMIMKIKRGTKMKDIIIDYFRKMQKTNLLNNNIENTYFIHNAKIFSCKSEETIESISFGNVKNILVLNGLDNKIENYEIIDTIKENIFTSVFKAKIKNKNLHIRNINQKNPILSDKELFESENVYVAIKKIYKDKIKEEMKFSLMKEEITDEDFKPEIKKVNKELENMKKCSCSYSVEIYDFYDTEKEFIIIMELCDETLFHLLCRKQNGFSSKEIKDMLLQLNFAFKIMNSYNIAHRDIKLNNILVKYLNKEKTKYKVLLSDYGVSNQIYSLTQKFTTHAGS